VGGCIVDSGKFDWSVGGRYPELTTPDDSYHGVVYTESFGPAAYITKARVQMLRDMGNTMSPMAAFLLNLGLETLALRMERHCANALAVAEFLQNHECVDWVDYPLLPGNSQYDLAKKYLSKGACGVISVGIKGGRAAATKFLDNLKLLNIVVHVADARSCALHPASTTHRQLTEEQLHACGVKPEQVRLSIGIENIEDILADLDQALRA
ncbi:MAG: O-acetylhomoserine aminocarboxypropyltransferase/cysteine synthase, partial [Clostridia bacterium]|nr:O-acetylhomoserine aminocarboxypropyltransferase/cysteine synthase [Clostridia bacterium]